MRKAAGNTTAKGSSCCSSEEISSSSSSNLSLADYLWRDRLTHSRKLVM